MLLLMVFLPIAAAVCCYPICRRSEKAGFSFVIGITVLVFDMALLLLQRPTLSDSVPVCAA